MSDTFIVSNLTNRLILNYINTMTDASELSEIVKDDPTFGSPKGRGLSLKMARAVLEYRGSLKNNKYTQVNQILDIRGIGADTFHDILTSFSWMSPQSKALIFFNTLKTSK